MLSEKLFNLGLDSFFQQQMPLEEVLNSATIAERRARHKAFDRMYKHVKSEKKAKKKS